MKRHRVAYVLAAALVLSALGGCANHTADTEAPVFLSADLRQGIVDIDISVPVDVAVPQLNIESHLKNPDATTVSAQEDVYLNEWVVTCSRTDGGTVASPVWHNFLPVYVPAGGSASLTNYRIFPSDYFSQPPLNQLFPENGGHDVETGKRTIRQRAHVEVFGQTVAGRKLSVVFDMNLNFYYVTQ
jgi:hypothetical protein